MFEEFFRNINNFYSMFSLLDYELLKQVILKMEEKGLNYNLIFLSSISNDSQMRLSGIKARAYTTSESPTSS